MKSPLLVFTKRTRIVFAAGTILSFIFILRLYQLQIIHGERYRTQADQQYIVSSGNNFERGSILFTTREEYQVPVASTKHGIKVAITPNSITDPEALYETINAITPLDREDFIKRASKTDDPYEEILHRLDSETAMSLQDLDSPHLRFHRESWRVYPQDSMAAQTVGFVAYDEDTLQGQYGLERAYEEVLRRDSTQKKNMFADILTSLSRTLSPGWFTEGDLVTTLDLTSQRELNKTVIGIHERWNSTFTGGIIIEPQTGAVVAMDAVPSFNPNSRAQEDAQYFTNPIVSSVYEMGSIMKPLIVASALDTNSITSDFSYNDTGSITIQDRTIYNFDKKGRGPDTTLATVLSDSLNTGMVLIEESMGHKTTRSYLEKLGFGERTGIDLPSEAKGLVGNLNTLGDVEYANISFGQGLALSPIAMTRALATLANQGKLPVPHIGDFVAYPEGSRKDLTPNETSFVQVFSPEATAEVSDLLVQSVDDVLGNGKYKNERYSIAAKTGTAQIPNPEAGGYYSDRNLHTFFGYFPATAPKYLVFLYTYHPKQVRFSSQTLASPFFSLADFLINYYHIPPDR